MVEEKASSPATRPREVLDENMQPQALTTDEATLVAPQSNTNGAPKLVSSSAGAFGGSSRSRRKTPPSRPSLPPYPHAYSNSANASRQGRAGPTGMYVGSPTGGVQVTLDGGGSWSDLARQDATLPADASGLNNEIGGKPESSGGVFGFLNRRKGRSHSPKPKERGILGKEGARVVIG